MKLAAADWSTALRLLDEALDRAPADRAAWLESLPPEYRHVLPLLRQLLDDRRAIETGDFLQALPALPAATMPAGFTVGHRIGPWALLRELGQGGMASVWLAERADGAHKREVALKLPWLGARARVIGERFAREREILSALTHPHIASVLDAGVDGTQPWLALEYVQGQPLTVYAQAQGLNTAAKLRLFLQVLQAVQHAHAQLVIHRDLKPSNVMVDEQGQVKLLDFGVAKLLDDDGASRETELTQLGGRAMTPQYASPEQVAGHALGTASDVYSLAVLLYELLTGKLPYTLKRDTPAALEEAILGAHVQPPSVVAADKTAARPLRGDLDTIVMKALAMEPARRYTSAEAFALDIERHLDSRPIEARPSVWRYRLGKLLARHRLAFGAGGVATAALLTGLGVALWQGQVAQREGERAEAVGKFLAETLSLNDPEKARGRELSARELLDLSAQQIDAKFAGDAVTQAQLHHTVGEIYIALGAIEQARPHIDRAVDLYEVNGARGTRRHVDALFNRMEVFEELSDNDGARDAALRTQREAARAFGPDHRWNARLLASLAWADLHQGRFAAARANAEQALAAQRRLSGESSAEYRSIATVLAHVYLGTDELALARAVYENNLRLGANSANYSDGDRLMDRYNLARLRFTMSDHAAIEAELRELAPQMAKHFGAAHDRTIVGRSLLAQTLAHAGHFDEAVAMQRANLESASGRSIADDEVVAGQSLVLALILSIAGRPDEAVVPARQGLAHFEAKYPQPTTYRERGRFILGEALLASGQPGEGLSALRAALANVDSLGRESTQLLRAPMVLSLAVAERRADAVAPTCGVLELRTGQGSLASLRCRTIEAWLNALAAPAEQRDATLARFVAARTSVLAVLPALHGLRAELLAAEAEIVQSGNAARAADLRAQAGTEYRRVFGRALPSRLLVVH